jgi:hypothetical protein
MSSLYLGTIGGKAIYEIHAITKDLPFREFPVSEIADGALFQKIIEERYRLLANGKPIYCTAVKPDTEKKIEVNPHDERPGTVHFVALDKRGALACALSVAVDTGESDNGDLIGLPLENRWKRNGYPEGASLDRFRERYLRLNYQRTRGLAAWEMAELYRHFRVVSQGNDIAPRIGLYTGCYHLLVREAIKKRITPTWIWVFDAIPSYFNLYRWAGWAALRDMTVEDTPRWLSPPIRATKKTPGSLQYRGEEISRGVRVPIPQRENDSLMFQMTDVHFLDGVIDLCRNESLIFNSPVSLSPVKLREFGWGDKLKMRVSLTITTKRCYEDSHPNHTISNLLNRWSLKMICPSGWDFNHIGDLQEGRSRHPSDYTV